MTVTVKPTPFFERWILGRERGDYLGSSMDPGVYMDVAVVNEDIFSYKASYETISMSIKSYAKNYDYNLKFDIRTILIDNIAFRSLSLAGDPSCLAVTSAMKIKSVTHWLGDYFMLPVYPQIGIYAPIIIKDPDVNGYSEAWTMFPNDKGTPTARNFWGDTPKFLCMVQYEEINLELKKLAFNYLSRTFSFIDKDEHMDKYLAMPYQEAYSKIFFDMGYSDLVESSKAFTQPVF